MRLLSYLTAVTCLALCASAQTTWVVDVLNPNPPGSGTASDPYTSVQFAISQPLTLDGDLVSVRPGVYFEAIDFLGKDLRVSSTDGPDVTILDAGGSGSVVTVASGEPPGALLEGFTLRGGSGTFDAVSGESRGGAVYCVQSALQVRDCVLKDNATVPPGGTAVHGAGGGFYAFGADYFALFDCEIEDNQASRGGGGWIEQSTALVFWTAIHDNTAVARDLNHAGWGGGLGVLDSNLNFDICTVERNEAEAGQFVPARGGGLLIWSSTGNVLNSLIADNVAGSVSTTDFLGQGGGLEVMFLDGPEDIQIGGCDLSGNLAFNGGGFFGMGDFFINQVHDNTAQNGAGVYSFGIVMRNCAIHDNEPLDPGAFAAGLGLFTDPTTTSEVEDSVISGHVGMGQGMGVWGGNFVQCRIEDNHAVGGLASSGGGAFLATLTWCRLTGNQALQTGTASPTADGGAMSSCNAERCLVWNNSANLGGGAAASSLLHCTLFGNVAAGGALSGGAFGGGTIVNSIVWGNLPEDVPSGLAAFSDIGTGFVTGVGNISADPDFWQPLNEDFRLRPGSPCIDAGDPLSTADLDGSRADMGALPFDPNAFAAPFIYCTPKVNSLGCTPNLSTSGAPSVSVGAFQVRADNVLNNQNGILFWGTAPAAQPFQGGTLCVTSPVVRTPVQSSGGSGGASDCSGSYTFQWTSAYIQSQFLEPGDRIFAQFWSRDPGASFGVGLTAGVDFTLIP